MVLLTCKLQFYRRETDVNILCFHDRQQVICWAINHLLARTYFDSNTPETIKQQMQSLHIFRH